MKLASNFWRRCWPKVKILPKSWFCIRCRRCWWCWWRCRRRGRRSRCRGGRRGGRDGLRPFRLRSSLVFSVRAGLRFGSLVMSGWWLARNISVASNLPWSLWVMVSVSRLLCRLVSHLFERLITLSHNKNLLAICAISSVVCISFFVAMCFVSNVVSCNSINQWISLHRWVVLRSSSKQLQIKYWLITCKMMRLFLFGHLVFAFKFYSQKFSVTQIQGIAID